VEGRGLTNYFAGTLLMAFANAWRAHLSAMPGPSPTPIDDLPYDTPSKGLGPADTTAQREAIRDGLSEIESEMTRAALVLTEDGYYQEEIAQIIGISRRAVEGLLRRHRQGLAARSERGESHR
jgi:DNA-directed RNA polymerase specialized sigma24 family protein